MPTCIGAEFVLCQRGFMHSTCRPAGIYAIVSYLRDEGTHVEMETTDGELKILE